MPIYTYVKNVDPRNSTGALLLRNGSLTLYIGQYADLTKEEINEIKAAGAYVLEEGIIPPAVPAGGGGNEGTQPIFLTVWKANTYFKENQLVVSPEGELLRTLKNFESGKEYYAGIGGHSRRR